MSKLSRTERIGLCLLAVILAVILGVLAIRRQTSETDIPVAVTVPDTAPTVDSLPSVRPVERSTSKNNRKTKQRTRKAAETPRRHLDDPF